MHCKWWSLVIAGSMAIAGAAGALAQDATPPTESSFASLGLPELNITATNTGMVIDQSEVPAGRYLVHFSNATDNPEASAGFVRLPEGHTIDEVSSADEMAAGTPVSMETGPSSEELAWLYDTYITGGGSVFSPDVVVDLKGGNYGVWADDPTSPLAAAPLTVTGDPDAEITGPEPEAAVTIVEEGAGGDGFRFTVQGDLTAGTQVVKVLNASDQPHFIVAVQYPEPITAEQVMASLMFDPSTGATPTPDMIDPNNFATVGWVSAQSSGTTQWTTLTLEPGQVVLTCFVGDPKAGDVPHAFEGMTQLVDVG